MARLFLPFLVIAFSIAAVGCDDPTPDIGVELGASGELTILWSPCHDTRTTKSVQLEGSNGEVLWRIESVAESRAREFVVGREPKGFSTKVPLTANLHGVRLRATVSDGGPEYFDIGEIEVGKVFVIDEGNMTAQAFWARNTCG